MDFRDILQAEFKKRNEVNVKYSLRSFSTLLDLDTSTLSQILKGKRKIPKTHWHLIADKLKLSGDQRQNFLKSLIGDFVSNDISLELQNAIKSRESLKLDDSAYFEIISEWEFAAALSLLNMHESNFSAAIIEKRLGIKFQRAQEVFDKLIKYQLISKEKNNFFPKSFNFHTSEENLSLALQRAHKNELKLAIDKIDEAPISKREYQSLTLSVRKKDIPKMKVWLKEMVKDFESKFENTKEADEVYMLSTSLFPLTENEQ